MYASRDDLEKTFGPELIARLAIREDDPEGTETVARALAYADGLVDASLSVRFVLPFAEVPPILKDVALDLALVRLATGVDATTLTDDLKARDKTARGLLERIAKGEMNLGLPARDASDRPQPIASSTGGKLFTRDRLRGL
jgi:phage gp36-like protein